MNKKIKELTEELKQIESFQSECPFLGAANAIVKRRYDIEKKIAMLLKAKGKGQKIINE